MAKWKTRHYEIRSKEHFKKKVDDRVLIAQASSNAHYRIMHHNFYQNDQYGIIKPSELHYDDGTSEINMNEKYDWTKVY